MIGDSIVKHTNKANVISKDKWKNLQWINAGLSGDYLENIHWRIKDYEPSTSIEKHRKDHTFRRYEQSFRELS